MFLSLEVALEDTNFKEKLVQQGLVAEKQTPRLVTALQKKLFSTCVDFACDFRLHCLWEDILLAQAVVSISRLDVNAGTKELRQETQQQ